VGRRRRGRKKEKASRLITPPWVWELAEGELSQPVTGESEVFRLEEDTSPPPEEVVAVEVERRLGRLEDDVDRLVGRVDRLQRNVDDLSREIGRLMALMARFIRYLDHLAEHVEFPKIRVYFSSSSSSKPKREELVV